MLKAISSSFETAEIIPGLGTLRKPRKSFSHSADSKTAGGEIPKESSGILMAGSDGTPEDDNHVCNFSQMTERRRRAFAIVKRKVVEFGKVKKRKGCL